MRRRGRCGGRRGGARRRDGTGGGSPRHVRGAAGLIRPRTLVAPGRVRAGTSGFAYPDWAPRFYAAGTPARSLLARYAERIPAVELNNTFYARPTPARIDGWVAATPESFRFVVKAQRGAAWRSMRGGAPESIPWLVHELDRFGARLGAVLFRVPEGFPRDDAALRDVLAAWPPGIPLVVELQDPGWHVDETVEALRASGAVLCTTDLDDAEEPPIRRTGPFLYLRLRRAAYTDATLDAWAARIVPFLDDGLDAFVILRHDADGANAVLATDFANRVERLRGRSR